MEQWFVLSQILIAQGHTPQEVAQRITELYFGAAIIALVGVSVCWICGIDISSPRSDQRRGTGDARLQWRRDD